MSKLSYPIILAITESFYAKATTDVLIGFQFRVIEDFDTHIPRIADFWQLQLTGKLDHRESLPFKLIPLHKQMNLTTGMVDRWVVLFYQTLDHFFKEQKITQDDKDLWKKKVDIFKNKIRQLTVEI